MKKVVCFGLCFLIVLCSFVVSFADPEWVDGSGSPSILPTGDPSFPVSLSSGVTVYYSARSYPVYVVAFNNSSLLFFSESPGVVIDYRSPYGTGIYNLSSQYNGYYYSSSISNQPIINLPLLTNVSSPTEVIDFVDSSVFSVSFDLSYLVDGAGLWLSTLANAVLEQPLLLFLILSIFVGIGIGLLNRFRR